MIDDLISRQAAIDALDKRFDDVPMELTTEILLLRKDLREVIPSAQPEERTNERTETHACDLISRQEVIKEFDCCELTPDGGIDVNYAIDFLNQLPSAQPEIIHCQDCKWWEFDEEGPYKSCNAAKHYYYTKNWEIGIQRKYPGGFYCADAERRENEVDS